MNLLLLKQLSIVSAFLGGIIGIIALIPLSPLFTLFVFLLSFVCPAIMVLVYLKQHDLIGIINVQEGAIYGAVIGVASFLAEFIVLAPLSIIISWIFKLFNATYISGFLSLLSFDFGVLFVLFFFVISLAMMSALFNGFTGLATAYVYELITGMKKENGQNNSVDFEIK